MQLAMGQWPLLVQRDISQGPLGIGCSSFTPCVYARFVQGGWPRLTYLSLASHGMNNDCAAHLVNADWPKLQIFDLRQTESALKAGLVLLRVIGQRCRTCVYRIRYGSCMGYDVSLLFT